MTRFSLYDIMKIQMNVFTYKRTMEAHMDDFDLSGFQMCHLDDDMHSVLYEQRIIHGMTRNRLQKRRISHCSNIKSLRAEPGI